MTAIVCDTSLRAMNKGKSPLKSQCGEDRAQRLACLCRIDRQRLTSEVLLAVLGALGPLTHSREFFSRDGILEHTLLVREHLGVLGSAEQLKVVDHLLCILTHDGFSPLRFPLGLEGGLGHPPYRRIDGHVHIAGEDGKTVIAMVWTRVVPGVHLPEGNAHL